MKLRDTLPALILLSLGSACTPTVPLDNRPCPCAAGWVCCAAGVCAKDQATCPADNPGGGGLSPDAGMSVDGQPARGPYMTPNAPSYPPDPVFMNPVALAGGWTGYFENFHFASGSDAVKVTLGAGATLSVVLGAEPAPPAPTNPTVAWPPGTNVTDPVKARATPTYVEGFAYTAHDVQWVGERLTFSIASDEAWQAWCGLQATFYVNDTNTYNCVPGSGGAVAENICYAEDNQGTKQTPVSCAQFWQCSRCACDPSGCAAGSQRNTTFDVTFQAGAGSGSAVTLDGTHNLHLLPAP